MLFKKKPKFVIALIIALSMIMQFSGPLVELAYAENQSAEEFIQSEDTLDGSVKGGEKEETSPGTEEESGVAIFPNGEKASDGAEGNSSQEEVFEEEDELVDAQNEESMEENIELRETQRLILESPDLLLEAKVYDKFDFLTSVKLTDKNGNELTGITPLTTELRIQYNYSLPDETIIKTTEPFVTYIPDELEIINDIEIILIHNRNVEGSDDEDKKVPIGTVTITKDKIITIQFNDEVNKPDFLYDRTGYFFVYSEFDREKIENTTEIEFNLGEGNIITVPIEVEKEVITRKVDLTKKGEYDTKNNIITWAITVKPSSSPSVEDINGLVIKDLIEIGQEYKEGSAKGPEGDLGTFNFTDRTLTYTFNQSVNREPDEEYLITFETIPDRSLFEKENDKVVFKNKAEGDFNSNPNPFFSNLAEVLVKVDAISKSGQYYPKERKIDWIITINSNYLDLKDPILKDILPEGLTLVSDSFKLFDVESDLVVPLGDNGVLSIVGNQFQYNFNRSINTPYKLSYSTYVTEEGFYFKNANKTFKNMAELTGENVPGTAISKPGINVTSSIIEKTGTGYNKSTKVLSWNVRINYNKLEIKNAVFTDYIPAGQTYKPGSLKLDGIKISDSNYLELNPSLNDGNTGKLRYEFPEVINKTYNISFETYSTNPDIYAGNGEKVVKNTATLTGDGIEQSDDGTNKFNSNVITKKGIGYDYVNREITWQVNVNQNKLTLNDAKFTDVIPEGQEFVEGFVTISDNSIEVDYIYNDEDRTLTYRFPDQITGPLSVTFKTRIVDLNIFKSNGEKIVENTAIFYANGINPVSSTGSQKIDSSVAKKSGNYQRGNDFIDWSVLINKNQLVIPSPVLEDTLQEGLKLDIASIKLQKVLIGTDNQVVVSEDLIPITMDNIEYDKELNVFTFKFLDQIDSAYLLSFSTDIDPEFNNKSFSNTIRFTGTVIEEEDSSDSIAVSFQEGGGGASGGSRGSIAIVKIDEDDKEVLIKGTEFNLVDSFGNVIKTATTNDNGKVVFDKLKLGIEYRVVEQKASPGYYLGGKVITFTLTSKDKNLIKEVTNKRIPVIPIRGQLRIKKIDTETQVSLAGAVFELLQNNAVIATSAPTDLNGFTQFDNVDYGYYQLREKIAPSGYIRNEKLQDVEVLTNGKTYEFTFTNTKIKANLEILKKGEDDLVFLPGAIFELLQNNKVIYTSLPTDAGGKSSFKDVEYGVYTLREKTAPIGYTLSNKIQNIEITENAKTYKMEVVNTKIRGKLVIKKVDENGDILEGAVFELKNLNSNSVETFITDNSGLIAIENLEFGRYTLIEVEAPAGYSLDQKVYDVDIETNEQEVLLTVVNNKLELPATGGEPSDPGTGEKPSLPDTGGKPSNPSPDKPILPATGTSSNILFYLLGISLVTIGSVALLRKRKLNS